QRIIDRWGQLRTNVLAASNVIARLERHASSMGEAIDREFQKWPRLGTYVWPNSQIYVSPTTYEGIITAKRNWIQSRYAWIDRQFLVAPTLNLASGHVTPRTPVSISADAGTVYYT